MKLSQEQLEWIVREIVRRLQSTNPSIENQTVTTRLTLTDRLVTTETLRGKLEGVTQVDTASGTVVTPAVVDLLRERHITLVRGTSHEGAQR